MSLSAFSLLLVITQVWISPDFLHRMRRASARLLTTNARGHREQAAREETSTLMKHFSRFHNTVLQYSVTMKTRSGGVIEEWQRGFDLTSEGYWWRRFIDWIICWVTRDTHTPLRWGNLSVRSTEEEHREQTNILSFNSWILFYSLQWFAKLFLGYSQTSCKQRHNSSKENCQSNAEKMTHPLTFILLK